MAEQKKQAQEIPGFSTSADVARILGITQQAVRDLARKGIIAKYTVPAGERYKLVESVQAYIQHLKDRQSGKEYDIEIKKAEADLKRSKAKRAALDLKEIEGKMHRSEDVEALTTDFVYTVRAAILSIPGRLAVDMANAKTAPEAAIKLKDECYQILRDLASYQYDPAEYIKRARERANMEAKIEEIRANCGDDE